MQFVWSQAYVLLLLDDVQWFIDLLFRFPTEWVELLTEMN